jgi:hypothetical protein
LHAICKTRDLQELWREDPPIASAGALRISDAGIAAALARRRLQAVSAVAESA